jgi:hypothetical protein
MKSLLIRILGCFGAGLLLPQCAMHRSSIYKSQMADLRRQVKVGSGLLWVRLAVVAGVAARFRV